ncbi:MAG TPA: chorismate-binding protein [Vicinamibacterales bacterium]
MRTVLAFLQTGTDAIVCVPTPLEPVVSPRAGSPAFFAPDFSMSPGEPWWFGIDAGSLVTLSRSGWQARFPASHARPVIPTWGPPDERRFAEGFRTLAARLEDGSLRKGVPVTVMTAPVDPGEAAALFGQAVSRVPGLPPNLYAYGFYRPASDTGTGSPEFLIGATPELLFEIDGGRRLSTMAVAGTRRAGGGAASLAASPKDRDEHQTVVEDLLARLTEWGQPIASDTEVRSFGQLEHLAVDIQLEAAHSLDFEAVARRLHPTPAIGVSPRCELGTDWLAGLDPRRDRKRFGAPFGLRWPSGAGRCVVAIRNLQYRDGQLEIWAGCGVVAQSRYENEWQEVLDKMQVVRVLWGV